MIIVSKKDNQKNIVVILRQIEVFVSHKVRNAKKLVRS